MAIEIRMGGAEGTRIPDPHTARTRIDSGLTCAGLRASHSDPFPAIPRHFQTFTTPSGTDWARHRQEPITGRPPQPER